MTCERIRPLLSGYHDDALSPEERARVRTHLATCAACGAVLTAYETMYATLQGVVAPVPPDLRRNVYARIAEIEAGRNARPPFAPAFLALLRAAGGTAGLLAVLAALVAAIIRLGAPQHAAVPTAARSDQGISAAGTALQQMVRAVRSGNLHALPPAAQTAVAPLGHLLAAGAQWHVDKMSVGAAHVTVQGHVVRVTRSGAPLAVVPVRLDAAVPREARQSPARGAVVKSIAVGTPSPIPTIPARDGIVYVHLGAMPAVAARAGASRGDLEWQAFAPGGSPLVLVTPGPSPAQSFTGLSASRDGDAVTYAVAGRGSDAGIFRLTMGTPHPTKVLDYAPPHADRPSLPASLEDRRARGGIVRRRRTAGGIPRRRPRPRFLPDAVRSLLTRCAGNTRGSPGQSPEPLRLPLAPGGGGHCQARRRPF